MKLFKIFIAAALTVLLMTSCSKKKNFIVQGEIEGIGAQLVNATYFADGGLKHVTASSADNKFRFRGESSRPTLLTLTLADGSPLATIVVENGDKITVRGNVARPYDIDVTGNGDSEKIAGWIKNNAQAIGKHDADAINRSLARWVGDNRSSKAATALMVSYFYTPGYEHMADSLLTLINQKARSQEIMQNFTGALSVQLGEAESARIDPMNLYDASDSVVNINPRARKATLLCFMSDNRTARDSVTPRIKELSRKYADRRIFEAVEISSAPDSVSWRKSLAGDTVSWRRTWSPATVASTFIRRLSIPRHPYFIVTDSAGKQIYRGPSIKAATATIDSKLAR